MSTKSLKTRLAARLHNASAYAIIPAVLGKELTPKKWVFVVGSYNSGTTLLDSILQLHPDISGLEDEGVMLTNQLDRPEDYGWTRMWHACEDAVSLNGLSGQEERARIIKRDWSLFYPDDPKQVLLEKSIVNTVRIPFLNRYFEPAYFIHILRNGYAVAEGIHRKARPGRYPGSKYDDRYPIGLCARQWAASCRAVTEQQASNRKIIEIRYEDLCKNPLESVNRIAMFLGLGPFQSEWLTKKFNIHGLSSEIKNKNHESFRRLSAEDINVIQQEAGFWLERYGYRDFTASPLA